jgi:non-specific serine/threonine protein kinase
MFMLSLKSGGVGLNLTKASYIFHLDPWWNPATENQATDRAHRIGQKQSVFVTKLLMHNSVEEKISQLKAQKQALYQAVLNEDLAKRKNGVLLTKEDFNFLLE